MKDRTQATKIVRHKHRMTAVSEIDGLKAGVGASAFVHILRRPGDILAMQRIVGNQAIQRILAQPVQSRFSTTPAIQRMAATDIDKNTIIEELYNDKVLGKDVLQLINEQGIEIFACTKMSYKGKEQDNSEGVTFPYEDPIQIYINISDIQDNKHLASTIFHESLHALDASTPSHDDDSEEAMKKDLENEVNVFTEEIKYAIRKGGALLQTAKDKGYVIENESGEYIVNPEIPSLIMGSYDQYKLEKRSDRFSLENWQFENPVRIDLEP